MTSLVSEIDSTFKNWWVFVVTGLLFIACAVVILLDLESSFTTFAFFINIVILVNGFSSLFFTLASWRILHGRGYFLASAVIHILLGVALIMNPEAMEAALPLIVGFWLLYQAVFLVSASLDLKDFQYMGWGWIMFAGILLGIFAFLVIAVPAIGQTLILIFISSSFLLMGIGYIMLGVNLKKVKAETLKAVDNFKSTLKDAYDEAMSQE